MPTILPHPEPYYTDDSVTLPTPKTWPLGVDA
jgi:hypothetical protein